MKVHSCGGCRGTVAHDTGESAAFESWRDEECDPPGALEAAEESARRPDSVVTPSLGVLRETLETRCILVLIRKL